MSEFIYCPYCGARNASTNKFCENCGQKLHEEPDVGMPGPGVNLNPYSSTTSANYAAAPESTPRMRPYNTQSNQPDYVTPSSEPYSSSRVISGSYDAINPYRNPVEEKKFSVVKTISLIIFLIFFGLPILLIFISMFNFHPMG